MGHGIAQVRFAAGRALSARRSASQVSAARNLTFPQDGGSTPCRKCWGRIGSVQRFRVYVRAEAWLSHEANSQSKSTQGSSNVAAVVLCPNVDAFRPRKFVRFGFPVAPSRLEIAPWVIYELKKCFAKSSIDKTFVLRNLRAYDRHGNRHHEVARLSAEDAAPVKRRREEDSMTFRDCLQELLSNCCTEHGVRDILILSFRHTSLQAYLGEVDYMKLVEHHRATQADVTLACVPVNGKRSRRYGLVKIDDNGRVTRIAQRASRNRFHLSLCAEEWWEQRQDYGNAMQGDTAKLGLDENFAAKYPYIASMGLYVFKVEALQELLEKGAWLECEWQSLMDMVESHRLQACLYSQLLDGSPATTLEQIHKAMEKLGAGRRRGEALFGSVAARGFEERTFVCYDAHDART